MAPNPPPMFTSRVRRALRHPLLLSLAALLAINLPAVAAAASDRLYLAHEARLAAAATPRQGLAASDAEATKQRGAAGASGRGELWLEQTLDHFNPADGRTFRQRYHEDLTHFNAAAGGPVMLVICGEAPCNGVPSDYRMELAAHFGAAVVALEHRFYGQSQPFADLSTASLAYLSANQALADLATFRQFYQQRLDQLFNGSHSNGSHSNGSHSNGSHSNGSHSSTTRGGSNGASERQWVVTGVSYAGALSAWARLSYPHLFRASLASSAVINVIQDFHEFEAQVVQSAGPQCAAILANITRRVEQQLASSPGDRQAVKHLFAAASVEHDGDFLFLLADAAVFAFQYGRPDQLCDPLIHSHVTGSDTMEAFAAYVRDLFFAHFGSAPSDYDRHALANTSLAAPSANMRTWLYQCCSQMAFFQTPARLGPRIRSNALNMSYWQGLCAAVYGDHPRALFPDVDATNTFFGATSIASSRIYFTNGSQDPWKRASRLVATAAMPSTVVECHNCGHGVDMRGCPTWLNDHHAHGAKSSCSDPSALAHVRGRLRAFLTVWLQPTPLLPSASSASAARAAM
ncbi:unnamed protein product [Closterium sp. NIES-64]|nr:unnamed protein product [Closterium sp. NIES-64]CAI5991145.1 unnamed protein product [Closterium sp. NIES-65]